jgi:hypothetical protein
METGNPLEDHARKWFAVTDVAADESETDSFL